MIRLTADTQLTIQPFCKYIVLHFLIEDMALIVRNRLAVRIAGSHPADRGSIPRYGSNHYGLQPNVADLRFLRQKIFFAVQIMLGLCFCNSLLVV
jgi:hypothetical protein